MTEQSNVPVVTIVNGAPRADSRDIAAFFRREHRNVLRDIAGMHCSAEFRRLNFEPFKIKDLTGESTSHVTMTKDGFTFLVMGFTGAAAAVFKEAYIARFNAMEAEIRRGPVIDPMVALSDPATMRALLLGYSEKVLSLEGRVAELAPQAEALERLSGSDGSLCITDAAKSLQVNPRALFRFLRENRWIYTRAGAGSDIAYQERLSAGDLEHKITTVQRSDGTEKTATQVRVTPKGLAKLAKLLPPVARVA